MMPIKWQQTEQQKLEVALWVANKGPVTPAVEDAWTRNSMTFAAALITREVSDGFSRN